MTIRSFASTLAANRSWTGVAVLLPIGAALLAVAALAETAHLLLALAEPACAACVDARNLMGGAAAGAGAAGAGAAGAGAAGSGGLGGGPTPPYSDGGPHRPHQTDPADDVGDITPKVLPTRPPFKPGPLLRFSRRLDKWVKDQIGPEQDRGTNYGGGRA